MSDTKSGNPSSLGAVRKGRPWLQAAETATGVAIRQDNHLNAPVISAFYANPSRKTRDSATIQNATSNEPRFNLGHPHRSDSTGPPGRRLEGGLGPVTADSGREQATATWLDLCLRGVPDRAAVWLRRVGRDGLLLDKLLHCVHYIVSDFVGPLVEKEPTLAEAVRQIMSAFRGHFGIGIVRRALEERFPMLAKATSASVLSNTLKRVAESAPQIYIVTAGRGRRSTVYYNDQKQKPDAETSGQDGLL